MFSIGSDSWAGTSKVIEEMGELGQVLGKLIATAGETDHWDGSDLRARLLEEIGDVKAALCFFEQVNLTHDERRAIETRSEDKTTTFWKWHLNK